MAMTAVLALQTLALGDWFTTFSLIFGGCCSNALALELITTQYPPAGTLITFTQFLLVAVASLRNQLTFNPAPVTPRTAVQAIVNRLEDLRHRTPPDHTLNVALRGPEERVAELSGSLYKSGSHLLTDRGNRVFTAEVNGSTDIIGKPGKIVLDYCAPICQCNSKHDFVITLRATRESDHKPDCSRNALVLDVTNPARPIFVHPLPKRSQRLFHFYRYRLKPRNIPLTRYAIQVTLFFLINLLNNAAFAYNVPMAVHIIFRSGGLVVNMLLGRLLYRRRYSRTQVFSILLVTFGVALTTLSTTHSKRSRSRAPSPQAHEDTISFAASYATGIALLTLALLLSGILGHQQDACFAKYGRSHWAEALFYLHALALPLFGFTAPRMAREMRAVSSSMSPTTSNFLSTPILDYKRPTPLRLALSIPAFYLPLLLNALTQLLCVAGVNRLTARVSSLTVTLVLVVRKAVSLAISVIFFNKEGGKGRSGVMLWTGAAAVLAGTVLYTIGSRKPRKEGKEDEGKSKEE